MKKQHSSHVRVKESNIFFIKEEEEEEEEGGHDTVDVEKEKRSSRIFVRLVARGLFARKGKIDVVRTTV